MLAVCFRNELVKLVARRRTWAGFAVFPAVEVLLLAMLHLPKVRSEFGRLLDKNGIDFIAAFSALTLATYVVAATVAFLGVLYLVLVAADLVAAEVDDGTMRLQLARPVTRLQLLAGKIGVSVVLTFAFSLYIGASALAVAALAGGGMDSLLAFAPTQGVFAFHEGGEALWRYARAVLLLGVAVQVVTALGMMFSCLPLRPATATVLALTVLMTDVILGTVPFFQGYADWFLTHHLACWLLSFQYVVPWTRIAESLVYLGAVSATCWVVGAMVFQERDLR